MSGLVQVFGAKAHGEQILECDNFDIGLVQFFATLVFVGTLNGLWCACPVPVASYHEDSCVKGAMFADDLAADAAWTATAFEIAGYGYGDDVAPFDLAC